MRISTFIAMGLCTLLTACSSSGLKPNQHLDLTPYVEKVKNNCLEKGKYKDKSKEDQEVLCLSNGQHTMKTSKRYLMLYQEDIMLDKCGGFEEAKQTECLLQYQKKHYDYTINKLMSQKNNK